jgi:hypothetical protein
LDDKAENTKAVDSTGFNSTSPLIYHSFIRHIIIQRAVAASLCRRTPKSIHEHAAVDFDRFSGEITRRTRGQETNN